MWIYVLDQTYSRSYIIQPQLKDVLKAKLLKIV